MTTLSKESFKQGKHNFTRKQEHKRTYIFCTEQLSYVRNCKYHEHVKLQYYIWQTLDPRDTMSLDQEIPDVSKDGSAFFLRGKAVQAELFLHCSALEYEGNKIFEMLATIHPSTQLHNPEEVNPQQHQCDSLAKRAN